MDPDCVYYLYVYDGSPRMKRNIGIRAVFKNQWWIQFDASEFYAGRASAYGRVTRYKGTDTYELRVDSRYDFDEVVAYLKSL